MYRENILLVVGGDHLRTQLSYLLASKTNEKTRNLEDGGEIQRIGF